MKSQFAPSSVKSKSPKMKNSWKKFENFCSWLARANTVAPHPASSARFGMPSRPSQLPGKRWLAARRRNIRYSDRRYGSYYHKGTGFKTAGRWN